MFGKKKEGTIPEKILEVAKLEKENIKLWLKGGDKEWLICTDGQVYIIKTGFWTGNAYGAGVFRMPYKNIKSATVVHKLTGTYFQLESGETQNEEKRKWIASTSFSPIQSQNCVSIMGKDMASKFKNACNFILDKVHKVSNIDDNVAEDIPILIKKLADLKDQGILTEEEFTKKKTELLAKI